MDRPVQVGLDPEQRRLARRRAAAQGRTLSDYIARLVAIDLDSWTPGPRVPEVIPVEPELPPDHEGRYIGEAVAERMAKPPQP